MADYKTFIPYLDFSKEISHSILLDRIDRYNIQLGCIHLLQQLISTQLLEPDKSLEINLTPSPVHIGNFPSLYQSTSLSVSE